MELFLGFAIIIVAYILFACISYKIWVLFFDTVFKTFNKRMNTASIIFGVLWLIGLPILLIITVISMFAHEK